MARNIAFLIGIGDYGIGDYSIGDYGTGLSSFQCPVYRHRESSGRH